MPYNETVGGLSFFAEVRTKPKGEILWQKIHLWDIS